MPNKKGDLLSREVTFEEFRNKWLREIDDAPKAPGGWSLVDKDQSGAEDGGG